MSDAIERHVTARVPTGRKGKTETLPGTIVVSETGIQFHYSTSGHTHKLVVPREQIAFVAADTPTDGEAKLRINTRDGKKSEIMLASKDDVHVAKSLLSAE